MARTAHVEQSRNRPPSDTRVARMALPTIPDAEEVTQSRMPAVVSRPLPPPPPKRLGHSGLVPRAPRIPIRIPPSAPSVVPLSLEATLIDARLSLDLEAVDRMLAEVAYDPSMAARTMRARVQELAEIAESMTRIHILSVHDEVAALFGPRTPLSRYLRSVQDSCAAIVRASRRLAIGLRSAPASWTTLRRQIEEAAELYHPELADGAVSEVAGLHARAGDGATLEQLADELDQLIGAVDWFHQSTRLRIDPPPEP